jgi:hypothetical protein
MMRRVLAHTAGSFFSNQRHLPTAKPPEMPANPMCRRKASDWANRSHAGSTEPHRVSVHRMSGVSGASALSSSRKLLACDE